MIDLPLFWFLSLPFVFNKEQNACHNKKIPTIKELAKL